MAGFNLITERSIHEAAELPQHGLQVTLGQGTELWLVTMANLGVMDIVSTHRRESRSIAPLANEFSAASSISRQVEASAMLESG
jgi:hypothetical protein